MWWQFTTTRCRVPACTLLEGSNFMPIQGIPVSKIRHLVPDRCELSSTAWWETANPGIAELALSCCHARVYLQHCFTWFCYAQANKKHLQIYHDSSPFTLKNEASIWSPCAPAPVTHTAVLPNLANDGRESIWKDFGEKGGSSLVICPGLTTNL